ncbi:hypothetical protein PAHAL_9G462100 [Panicum hallii]|uniref:Uncharacterized protein n=1 Tax=Panicum hallii TaxID=206008 RepID=A0A2T8I4U8_9POAL|nr:hypothetical protein PAHAL_9G462100 [Panicum hallii]
MHKDDGTRPVKLLLLALNATRFLAFSHVVDGKDPVKKLLEMFSTCSGRPGIDDGSSSRPPPRRLKLTSRETMVLESISSNGRLPLRELPDRLRRSRPLRLPSGEMCPSRPLDARETSMTSLFALQATPSHVQQSVLLFQDAARPPSRDSPARNRNRELFSCS